MSLYHMEFSIKTGVKHIVKHILAKQSTTVLVLLYFKMQLSVVTYEDQNY